MFTHMLNAVPAPDHPADFNDFFHFTDRGFVGYSVKPFDDLGPEAPKPSIHRPSEGNLYQLLSWLVAWVCGYIGNIPEAIITRSVFALVAHGAWRVEGIGLRDPDHVQPAIRAV